MNIPALENFILKLDFISQSLKHLNSKYYKINILEHNYENGKVKGIIYLGNELSYPIKFDIEYIESENELMFQSNFQIHNFPNITTSTETFTLVNPQEKPFYKTPKIKYLIHKTNGELKQIYIVNKKYKFTNGIGESYGKVNMDNEEMVSNIINNYYQTPGKSKK